MPQETLIHGVAVAVAVDPDGPLAGALLLGPSGHGKTVLALAIIESCPWRRSALIADDAVLLTPLPGEIVARSPASIAGLLEVRGFGPARIRYVASARIIAGFDLAAPSARLPEPDRRAFGDGITLPVWPLEPGAGGAIGLRTALRSILGGQTR